MQRQPNEILTARQRMLLGLFTVSSVVPVNHQAAEMQVKQEQERQRASMQEAKANSVKMFKQQPSHQSSHKPHHQHVMGYSRKPR